MSRIGDESAVKEGATKQRLMRPTFWYLQLAVASTCIIALQLHVAVCRALSFGTSYVGSLAQTTSTQLVILVKFKVQLCIRLALASGDCVSHQALQNGMPSIGK